MNSIFTVKNLSKNYGDVQAVDSISFSIEEGICFGLLGPNGAGKTTTIEMMEGVLKPSAGDLLFRGKKIESDFQEKVGIQFQHTALQEYITVKETLNLFSALYKKKRSHDEIIEICSLGEFLNRDNKKLSGGQRQRLLLAIALLNDPEIVFLDEPTTGLDPQARRNFWSLIENIKKEGKTILLTTHYMEEAQILCEEIAIMDHGHIIAQGQPRQLLSENFKGVLVQVPQKTDSDDIPEGFEELPIDRDRHPVIQSRTDNVDESINALITSGYNLNGLSIHTPNLEDLFIKLTGESLRS